MAAADREHVFERFWRGKTAHSDGAGLGLAIVSEIMKIHGGNVNIEDAPTGGAVFTLQFRPRIERVRRFASAGSARPNHRHHHRREAAQ